jgi:hypothetical protein
MFNIPVAVGQSEHHLSKKDSTMIFEVCKIDFYETLTNWDDLSYYGDCLYFPNDSLANVMANKLMFKRSYSLDSYEKLNDSNLVVNYKLSPNGYSVSVLINRSSLKAKKIGSGSMLEFCINKKNVKELLTKVSKENIFKIMKYVLPNQAVVRKLSSTDKLIFFEEYKPSFLLFFLIKENESIMIYDFEKLKWLEYECYPLMNHLTLQKPIIFNDIPSWKENFEEKQNSLDRMDIE